MEIINGKELVFRVYFAEEAGNVEWTIQRKLLENIFLLDEEEMNLLYDDHYDVKVFLQRQGNAAPNETGRPARSCPSIGTRQTINATICIKMPL